MDTFFPLIRYYFNRYVQRLLKTCTWIQRELNMFLRTTLCVTAVTCNANPSPNSKTYFGQILRRSDNYLGQLKAVSHSKIQIITITISVTAVRPWWWSARWMERQRAAFSQRTLLDMVSKLTVVWRHLTAPSIARSKRNGPWKNFPVSSNWPKEDPSCLLPLWEWPLDCPLDRKKY